MVEKNMFVFLVTSHRGFKYPALTPTVLYCDLAEVEGYNRYLAERAMDWSLHAEPGDVFEGKDILDGVEQVLFTVERCEETGELRESYNFPGFKETKCMEATEIKLVARPWEPQDLLDDLQEMIDKEPDRYLNDRRTTLCMALDYLKEYFDSQKGVPLTVKELRKMPLKEWVWVRVLDVEGQQRGFASESAYYRKQHSYDSEKVFECGYPGWSTYFDYEDYGMTWVAYRDRPKMASG